VLRQAGSDSSEVRVADYRDTGIDKLPLVAKCGCREGGDTVRDASQGGGEGRGRGIHVRTVSAKSSQVTLSVVRIALLLTEQGHRQSMITAAA
jgi:hypothetical protein